jgi:tRNA G10  N-methylase Trm11
VTTTAPPHPARFTPSIMEMFTELADRHHLHDARVLDPFAGTGRVNDLGLDSVGVEIEPEWAGMSPRTLVGDATALPFPAGTFGAVITSPTYGNRMADHHDARDGSRRTTYRHLLGRPLSAGNAGAMQWGEPYQDLHRQA